jgi:hypothetical protein
MKTRIAALAALIFLLPFGASSAPTLKVWNAAEESVPANSDALSEANERMHDIKGNTRARAEVEHWWGDYDDADDNGLHRHGSARCFVQTSEPTVLSDSVSDFNLLAQPNGVTDLNDSASGSAGAIEDDVGHGRCWVDTDGADGVDGNGDDNALYFYEGVAGDDNGAWVAVSGGSGNDDEILAGSANLVYNGSFEATDGTGYATATTTPSGWADVTSPTIAYTDGGAGDLRWGDGIFVTLTNSAADSEGISFEMDRLPANTFYKVIARAKDDGTGTCTLDVTGEGGTAFTSDTTTTDAWETLSGTFGTDTTALDDNVLVTLVTNDEAGSGQACSWDHIQVYQIGNTTEDRDEVSVPTMVYVYAENTTLTTSIPGVSPTTVTDLQITVTPPQPNCIVSVNAHVQAVDDGSQNGGDEFELFCAIDENGTDVANSYSFINDNPSDEAHVRVATSSHVTYTKGNPAPGTPLVYSMQCTDDSGGVEDDFNYNCDDEPRYCYIEATMFCGGH